jgi:hypothetical protein
MKNRTQFRPISMKCNQEQFDEIRPILEKARINIQDVYDFNNFNYLTNNYAGEGLIVTNIKEECADDYNRNVYPKWNKEVFLNACGIAINLYDVKVPMSDKPIDVSPTPKDTFKTIESNPLDNLPIIGEGVLMEVSQNEITWVLRFVFAKQGDGYLYHYSAENKKDINFKERPLYANYARPIAKTKITRAEFESKYEIID